MLLELLLRCNADIRTTAGLAADSSVHVVCRSDRIKHTRAFWSKSKRECTEMISFLSMIRYERRGAGESALEVSEVLTWRQDAAASVRRVSPPG